MSTESVRRSVLLAAAIAALIVVLDGCCRNVPPKIVTVVVPYTAVIILDSSNHALGATGCDLNNQPIIYLNPRLSPSMLLHVVTHERVHVEQIRAHDRGCADWAFRYMHDESFKLHAEAEAFCAIFETQLVMGERPYPDLAQILAALTYHPDPADEYHRQDGYHGGWSENDAKKAMRCWRE